MSNKQIATRLVISPKTVSNHVEHIYGKIGASTRARACFFAMQHGLVGAYERGEYKQVSDDDLTWIVAALNYLVDPFDLIPDMTPLLGFVDDATVIGFVADKVRQTLDEFMIWETIGVSNLA